MWRETRAIWMNRDVVLRNLKWLNPFFICLSQSHFWTMHQLCLSIGDTSLGTWLQADEETGSIVTGQSSACCKHPSLETETWRDTGWVDGRRRMVWIWFCEFVNTGIFLPPVTLVLLCRASHLLKTETKHEKVNEEDDDGPRWRDTGADRSNSW